MKREDIEKILSEHAKWANGNGGARADLQGADLQAADLQAADLQAADLRDADLRDADLQSASLQGANLQGADLQGADLDYACWPLWCGSIGVRVDARIFQQLLGHLLAVAVDDPECRKIQRMQRLRRCAAKGHRAEELGLLK